MDKRNAAILLPSAYRARKLARCLDSLLGSNWPVPARIIVSNVDDDRESALVLARYPVDVVLRHTAEYARGAVFGWNHCLSYAPEADLYVLAADDLVFRSEWLVQALRVLDQMGGDGLVGLNDLSSNGEEYAAHWLASRSFVIEHGGGVMYPPMYRSWWCDREVTDLAQAAGCYRWARLAFVEHFHYTFQKAESDRTYREAAVNYEADRMLYLTRRDQGFPRTWTPIIS